jgi:drug/metabolite transporter (DMT)-like permease
MGLFNALGFMGQFVGQTMTNAPKTALLINLNLVTVAFLSVIILGEKFTKNKGLAVIFALFGVLLLTTDGDISQLVTGEFLGDMLALAGGFSWAFYIITNKRLISRRRIDVVTLTACVMLSTTLWMLPFTLLLGGFNSSTFDIGFEGWSYIIYLGIFCNVIPFSLWTFGLKYLTATGSTILLLIEVLVATVLAMILLNEFLTVIGLLGGAFIVVGIILINLNLKTKEGK